MTRWLLPLLAVALALTLLGNVYLAAQRAETARLADELDAEIPPITEDDNRQMDRQMLREIHAWMVTQKASRAAYEKALREGRIPNLPGVGR